MAHIDFSIDTWIAENEGIVMETTLERIDTPTKASTALSLLISAIKAADKVHCGWTVLDAEEVRTQNYGDRSDLSIEDSYCVIESADNWDASYGYRWDHLHDAYAAYVEDLDSRAAKDATTEAAAAPKPEVEVD
jgi:hypothetical protein